MLSNQQLFNMMLPLSMAHVKKMRSLRHNVRNLDKAGVKGAIVECGVYKGKSAATLINASDERTVWLFDSFQGLPAPTEDDICDVTLNRKKMPRRIARLVKPKGMFTPIKHCMVTQEYVESFLFGKLGLRTVGVHIVPGWFQETLPIYRWAMGDIALLHIDADWYESTKCAFEQLWNNVVKGGYVVVDDYGYWPGCKKATDEFMARMGVEGFVKDVVTARIFQKA